MIAFVLACSLAALEVPALSARVTDVAGVLPADRRASLEQELARYEQSTGHQLAVLIIPSLEGESLEEYSLRAAEQWRLGDKARDDGALLLVAVKDRRMRIEVGYGLEGALTDAQAGRIIRNIIAPRFAAGDYAGGIDAGVQAMMRAAENESIGPAVTPDGHPGVFASRFGFYLILVLIVLSLLSRFGRHRRIGRVAPILFPLFGGGFRGGGFRSGGGFGGGGGGFGGGGASGRW